MSLLNDKQNVFDTISAIKSFNSKYKNKKTSLESINNKKDSLGFLLDLLSVLVGVNGLIDFSSKMIIKIYDKLDEPLTNNILNKSINYYSDMLISDTNLKNGFTVNINEIDLFGKFKINPNSIEGEIIYDKNDGSNIYFDYSLYYIINDLARNNIIGNTEYYLNNNMLFIKPVSTNQTVNEYIINFLNNNNNNNNPTKSTFSNNVINKMFGVGGNYKNKTTTQISNELIVEQKLNNYIEKGNIELTNTDYSNIEFLSDNIKNGVRTIDWGCGYFKSSITLDDLNNLNDSIKNGNEDDVTNEMINLFNISMNGSNMKKETSKNDFSRSLIKNINFEFLKLYVLSPKYIIYKKIIQCLNDDLNENVDNLIKDDSVLCIDSTVSNIVNEELFNIVKKELSLIIKPYIKFILKEKSLQLMNIMKSLTNII